MYRSCLAILCLTFTSFGLQAEYFTIDDYHIDIQVTQDGKLLVQEKISVDFSSPRRGIYRNIPFKYNYDGKQKKLKITDVKVHNWEYKFDKSGNEYVIRFGNKDIYIDGKQIYNFSYTVEGAILEHSDFQELYYDILGNGWETTIDNFSYNISFPNTGQLKFNDYMIYSGKYGERKSTVSIQKEGNNLLGRSNAVLNNNESVSIAVRMPNGMFDVIKLSDDVGLFEKKKDKSYPIPLVILSAIFGFWLSRGRNEKVLASDELIKYPPDEMNPAEIGMLIDNKSDTRDLLSLVPYWANQGLLKIISMDNDDDLVIEKLEDISNDAPAYQKTLFEGIFKLSNYVPLSTLKQKIYSELNQACGQLKKEAYNSNYYDQKSKSTFRSWPMVVLSLVSLILGFVSFASELTFTGIASIIAAIVFLVLRFMPPKKSALGRDIESKIKSFKAFLKNDDTADISNIMNENPKYYEQMYPYAIALDLEKSFNKKFADQYDHGPSWYYMGDGSNNYRNGSFKDFTSSYNVENIQSAFTSVPASSSSSGGGGYSGGGSGGGGGGSW